MKNLKAKLNKQGGFTLIEMLIVVAIIAILVAVSIPLVNSALERAREATDAANERSFKAVLVISYTNGQYEVEGSTPIPFNVGTVYAYDAAKGTLATKCDKTYGKSTEVEGVDGIPRKGRILWGYIDGNGATHMIWGQDPSKAPEKKYIDNSNLISPKMVDEV